MGRAGGTARSRHAGGRPGWKARRRARWRLIREDSNMTSRPLMTLQVVVPPAQKLGAVVRNERAPVCVLEPIDRFLVRRSPRERTDLHDQRNPFGADDAWAFAAETCSRQQLRPWLPVPRVP